MKFNARGPEGLIDRKPPGQAPRLNGAHRAALAAIIESGPISAVHGVVRWRIVDLCQWIFEEFRVVVAKQTLSSNLRAMGYRKLSARPRHHAQAAGAICPKDGKGAALVMPRCNTEAMNLHLAEIATQIAPGAHAVLLVDQAGWHVSGRLIVPPNITLIPFPAKCPELNPQENIWQFLRDNWLSNRIFNSFGDIVNHCCDAWNTLISQPWRIMSIGLRDWAYRS